MQYAYIDPRYPAAIETHRLNSLSAWLDCSAETFIDDRTGQLYRVRPPAPLPGCFVKVYVYPTWRDRIRIFFRGGLVGRSRAAVEAANLRRLHAAGLAPALIAWSNQRRYGLLWRSVLVIEAVEDAPAMDAFIGQRLATLTRRQRQQFVAELAAFTRRMNAGGFVNSEYHWRNILVRQTADGVAFSVIDPCSRRLRHRLFSPFFDLASLDVAAAWFFTRTERLRFVKLYWGTHGQPLTKRQKRTLAQIEATRRKIAEKELKRYRMILPPEAKSQIR